MLIFPPPACAAGPVLKGDSHGRQLVANRIRPREIPIRARLNALADQLLYRLIIIGVFTFEPLVRVGFKKPDQNAVGQ